MASNSESFHESPAELSAATRDLHRALVSLMEELEAIDWYQQRIEATADGELKRILAHNRDEEKEHASMVLEWLRRSDPVFARHFKTYLFTEGSITEIEADAEQGGEEKALPAASSDGSLGIGSLRQVSK